jgi:ubiquinone/menaquinone biosynthesis C-methylase UbiE
MAHNDELDWLHFIRDHELSKALPCFPEKVNLHVLEIGSGTGYMLGRIKERYRDAVGLEVQDSAYVSEDPSIIFYDGVKIPYPDESVDVVFSSHVLEHIPDLPSFLNEVSRVLKKDGLCVHIVPSPTWRILTALMHYPALVKFAFSASLLTGRQVMHEQARKKKDLTFLSLFSMRHGMENPATL